MARILIVDDEEPVRQLLRQVLEGAGHLVHEAADGRDVDARLGGGPADLLILDVFMPDREGLETLASVRTRYPWLKVIVISGGGARGDLDVLRIARKLGADLVLPKPIPQGELLSAVAALTSPR